MLREFFLGFVRIHILYHASKSPVCGVEMMEELSRHGYSISPGTLYPILHLLEEEGYLRRKEVTVSGRVRKYYEITRKGTQVLVESKKKIKELVHEVLYERRGKKGI